MNRTTEWATPGGVARIAGRGMSSRGRLARLLLAVAAASISTLASCCACGPRTQAVANASLDTPRGTVEAFAAYLRAGLHEFEYRCFSYDFCQRNQVSLFTYAEAREELARRQPWLELFAAPTIVGDSPMGADRHCVDVRMGGRTYRVNLVREETFRISAGEETLAEDFTDFDRRAVARSGARAGAELVISLPLPGADIDLPNVTSVVLQRRWKIDGVAPLDPPN